MGGGFLLLGTVSLLVAFTHEAARRDAMDSFEAMAALVVTGGAGLLFLLTAIGVWTLQPWGRTCALVVAAIGLLGFPIGTIVNGLILGYLRSDGMRGLFSGRGPEDFEEGEHELLRKLQSSGVGTATGVVILIAFSLCLLIIPAIAIPNLLNAIQRGKQARRAADMKTVATALERHSIDSGSYPPTDGWNDIEAIAPLLEGVDQRDLPTNDGWNGPLRYRLDGATYQLVSAGQDGLFMEPPPSGTQTGYDGDLVIDTGEIVAWPQGLPRGASDD